MSQASLERLRDAHARMKRELHRVIVGQDEVIDQLLLAILSRGHCLLVGVPGLAKTLLISSLAKTLDLGFNRIQFTPDLMPGDITGTDLLHIDAATNERVFRFAPGPVFANVVLADEINRTPPKTQAALLESMMEGQVTAGGRRHALPSPFFVLATQNPIEQEGTYPLPEAQLDRFLFRLLFNHVDAEVLARIIGERRRGELPEPTWQMEKGQLDQLFAVMDRIFMPAPVARYVARLVAATHRGATEATDAVNKYVNYGASPRAAIAIAEAARAHALVAGRPTAGFEDVKAVAPPVLNHRILLNYQARFDKTDTTAVVSELLTKLDETGLKLPSDVTLEQAA